MFNKERWSEILEALNANRFRTFLTAFGVFWGILILIILLALTKGLRNGVEKEFGNYATNTIFMWGQRTSIPYKGLPKGRGIRFKTGDKALLEQTMPELKYISPRNQLGGFQGSNNVTRREKTGAFSIYGDYPEFIKQQPMDITAGRFLNYSDIKEKRKICIIGKDVIKTLFDKNEKVIGNYIQINGVNFTVAGTFEIPNTNGDQEENTNTIFIPFTTFSQAFNRADNVDWYVLTAHDEYNITEIKSTIFSALRKQHRVHPDDTWATGHFDWADRIKKQTSLFDVVKVVSYVVGLLILISGIIGISNIMLIVVKERTKEIGVRRALGATPLIIKSQILQESMVLTLLAGMLGVAAASGAIWCANYFLGPNGVENFVNPSVDISLIFLALIILVIAGLLAGFIPANRATRMKPIDALRIE